MRNSRLNHNKKSKKPMIISSVIAAVLIVGGVLVYTYKEDLFPEQLVNGSAEEPIIAAPNEKSLELPSQSEQKATVEKEPVLEVDAGGYVVNAQPVTEPTYINGILIANKKYPLPQTYNPGEVPEAKEALNKMLEGAKQAGYSLVAFSGFRSYEYQTTLYQNYINRDSQEAADRYSARPGYSEHQTGLAYDIGEVGREDLWLTAEFGETPAGKWLVDHAHEYGFILRYPQGKEESTGFMYESWHFRYLGLETAKAVKEAGVTLEEYLGIE